MQSKQIFLLSLLLASAFSHPMHRSISLGDLNALTTLQPDSAEFDDVAGRLQRIALVGQDQQLLDKAFRAATHLYLKNQDLRTESQDHKLFEMQEIRNGIFSRLKFTFGPGQENEAFRLLDGLADDLKTQTNAASLKSPEQTQLQKDIEEHFRMQKDFEQKVSEVNTHTRNEIEELRKQMQDNGARLLSELKAIAQKLENDANQRFALYEEEKKKAESKIAESDFRAAITNFNAHNQLGEHFMSIIRAQEETRKLQETLQESQRSLEAAAVQRQLAQMNSRLECAENRLYWRTLVGAVGVGTAMAGVVGLSIYTLIKLKGMPFQSNGKVQTPIATPTIASQPAQNTSTSSQGLETRLKNVESDNKKLAEDLKSLSGTVNNIPPTRLNSHKTDRFYDVYDNLDGKWKRVAIVHA